VSDHATDIADYVIFTVEGRDPRHTASAMFGSVQPLMERRQNGRVAPI